MAESHAEYGKIQAVNWSTLKHLRRSPKHYQHALAHPPEETPAMRLGRATHTATFEPDRFPLEYVVWKGDRRGKEYAAFCEALPDHTILKVDEYETCLGIRDAVRAHSVAAELLRVGRAEFTLTWTDPATGLLCKGRLDWLDTHASIRTLCDLKTTADLDPYRFAATVARMGHHLQLAFYGRGLRANGIDPFDTKIIAVESDPPHDVAVFAVDEDALYAADEELDSLLRRVAECRAAQSWPGRYAAEQTLRLPGWAFGPLDAAADEPGLDLLVNGLTQEVG